MIHLMYGIFIDNTQDIHFLMAVTAFVAMDFVTENIENASHHRRSSFVRQ